MKFLLLNKGEGRHQARDFRTQAIKGAQEVSQMVERVENFSPRMNEYADLVNVGDRINLQANNLAASNTLIRSNGITSCPTMMSNISDTIISLSVTRNSYNIPAQILPFVLWCTDNKDENYSSILSSLGVLPAGAVVTVSTVNNRSIRFTYVIGGNTDTIDISTNGRVSYPVLLQMLSKDEFGGLGFKYTAEANYAVQFGSMPVQSGQSDFSGVTAQSSIPVSSFKKINQYQNEIVNVDATYVVNSRRWVALAMAATPVGVATSSTIILDWYVDKYNTTGNLAQFCSR